MIPFALVFLWKNEKKLVTYSKVIEHAKSVVKKISVETAYDENDLCLVSCQGKTVNEQDINDFAFGACVKDSYRLKRTVEMLQWVEIAETYRERDEERTRYIY